MFGWLTDLSEAVKLFNYSAPADAIKHPDINNPD
jgi:hypothetical protein